MTLGFQFGSENFCKLFCVTWEVFVLHGCDWIHWVAKSCTTKAYRPLFRDSQLSLRTLWSAVIKSTKFTARGTTPPIRLLHGALVIFVLWQISQFRSYEKWVSTLCLPKSAHLAGVGSKDGSCGELACESLRSGTLSSTRFSLNSCSHSSMSEHNGSPRSWSWSTFLFGFGFWVGLSTAPLLRFQKSKCLPVLSFQHVYLTQLRDRNLSHTGLPFLVQPHLHLTQMKMSWCVEVDELEEDVGWSISCREGVMDVEEWDPEEELVDKPGTTIGTKFSVLHCIRIPFFLMRCGFWPLVQSYEYPCSSQSLPSEKTAGVSSKTFIVRNISNSLTYTIASSCVCTSPLAVMTIVGLHDFVKVSISAEFVLFADHVHRRSGVDNKFSFLRFKIWCRQALFSEDEKNAALFFSFYFGILLASLHAASRAPCSCHSVSSWDRSSNFGALGSRWWGPPGQIIPSEWFWSRMSAWRTTAFVNFSHRIGFRVSELFRKIDEDFGGSISWNTQPNCHVFDE